MKTSAWQRKEEQDPEGELNAKGRASYHAETGGTAAFKAMANVVA
jgi:hypothetical protein